jgi:hypothetical protein
MKFFTTLKVTIMCEKLEDTSTSTMIKFLPKTLNELDYSIIDIDLDFM